MLPSYYPKTNQTQFSIMWTNDVFPLLGLAKSAGEVLGGFFAPSSLCELHKSFKTSLLKKKRAKTREEELITVSPHQTTEHVSI